MKYRRNESIFPMILAGMVILLCIVITPTMGYLCTVNLPKLLNRNECEIVKKQTENRKTYLQGILLKDGDLTELSDHIDETLEELLEAEEVTLEELDTNSEMYVPFLEQISGELIDSLRSKDVTGIFVVLNTKDMSLQEDLTEYPGIYLRDLDPDAAPSYRNSDLLLERSPVELVKRLRISTDKNWNSCFTRGPLTTYNFIYPAFQAAYEDGAQLEESDYGHLTASPYILRNDTHRALAYSIPLILPDGTVYGVLGVEMLESYAESLMPSEELEDGGRGNYYLVHTESSDFLEKVSFHIAASTYEGTLATQEELEVEVDEDGECWVTINGSRNYVSAQPLGIYNRNTPFENEKWYLVGTVPEKELFELSNQINNQLWICIVVSALLGGVFCLFLSMGISYPFVKIHKELLEASDKKRKIPQFSSTRIKELEQFCDEVVKLSKEIEDTSTKFLQIMRLASVEMEGYEIRYDTDSVYVTDHFFEMLGVSVDPNQEMNVQSLREILEKFDEKYSYSEVPSGGKLYRVFDEKENVRYLHLKKKYLKNSQVGVVEDETEATLEQIHIRYERDYDALTNIYNRRAVRRKFRKLFETPGILKHGAVLMMDLDNLKSTNDTFGHEYGDLYIQLAAQCLSETMTANSLYGRLSGDEFFAFLYGYESREELQKAIDRLIEAVYLKNLTLPDGTKKYLSMSGGIALYPEHSENSEILKRYADFAMYQVKKDTKGRFEVFTPESYQEAMNTRKAQEEFKELIKEERVHYHFQPIVSAATGKTMGYEALMRSDLPSLQNPMEILKAAREASKLHEIERLTMFKSAEAFCALRDKGKVDPEVMLFINSISSQCLNETEEQQFIQRFSSLKNQIVVEITEEEAMDREILERKKKFKGFPKLFALDDYGSGYSNDKTLLELQPQFLKLDRSLIHQIDQDKNKQQLASYTIRYAHQQGIRVVAEGIENERELSMILSLDVDLLQGYYIGKPQAEPQEITEKVQREIKSLTKK